MLVITEMFSFISGRNFKILAVSKLFCSVGQPGLRLNSRHIIGKRLQQDKYTVLFTEETQNEQVQLGQTWIL